MNRVDVIYRQELQKITLSEEGTVREKQQVQSTVYTSQKAKKKRNKKQRIMSKCDIETELKPKTKKIDFLPCSKNGLSQAENKWQL